MDLFEFRNQKSGEIAGDAALQEMEQAQETEIAETVEMSEETTEISEQAEETSAEPQNEPMDGDTDEEDQDLPQLNEREKTAFEKRLERERRKLEEKMQQEYEQKFGRHKQIIDMLGGDPDAIEKRIREEQIALQARKMADQYGWDDEQTRWYIENEKQKRELFDLRIQLQVNMLKDNPDYAGIDTMLPEIRKKIEDSGGVLTVEQAYWALAGPKRAEQIKLEAQLREQARRQKQARTVLTDAQTPVAAEKPLPADIVREAERLGISLAEARRLMSTEPPRNLEDYRKRKKQTGG